MTVSVITSEPNSGAFVQLEEHQSQTPGTFFGGKPVLHNCTTDVVLLIPRNHVESCGTLAKLCPSGSPPETSGATGVASPASDQYSISGVDIWVNSENLILFNRAAEAGVSIPYPSISLHAIQRTKNPASPNSPEVEAFYMQLTLTDLESTNEQEDVESLEVIAIPPSSPSAATSNAAPTDTLVPSADQSSEGPLTPVRALFTAVSACADLHPDPLAEDDEQDGEGSGLGAPGAGGWITAENMTEFFDEDGHFIGGAVSQGEGADGGELGSGVGTVRRREDVNGDDEEDSEGRVNGDVAEGTKWQRTG